jgi:hypothetical protein
MEWRGEWSEEKEGWKERKELVEEKNGVKKQIEG